MRTLTFSLLAALGMTAALGAPLSAQGPANDFYAAGLTEEVSAQLAREPGLRVAGVNSARYFAGPAVDRSWTRRRSRVRRSL